MKTKKSDKRIAILLILTLIMAFIVVPAGEFNAGAGSDLSYADDIEDQIDQKENERYTYPGQKTEKRPPDLLHSYAA